MSAKTHQKYYVATNDRNIQFLNIVSWQNWAMLFGVQFMRHKKKVHKYNDSSLFTKHPIPGHSRASDTPYPADLLFLSFLRASLHFWAILFLFSLFLLPLFLLSFGNCEWRTLLNERGRKKSAVYHLQQPFSRQ